MSLLLTKQGAYKAVIKTSHVGRGNTFVTSCERRGDGGLTIWLREPLSRAPRSRKVIERDITDWTEVWRSGGKTAQEIVSAELKELRRELGGAA